MKALVLFSGGADSTTCLALAVEQYGANEVMTLSVSYGQKHSRELRAAETIAARYAVRHRTLDLAALFEGSECSLLCGSLQPVPQESYSEQIKKTDGKPVSTYVPFRNGLFLASAASIALSNGCSEIWYGAHLDDAAGNAYPDCSQDFNDAISRAVSIGSGRQLTVHAPFVGWNKARIIAEGLRLHVPYELTWSCYEGSDRPCGKCGTCLDRQAAFLANGVIDPLMKGE